jgi:hypothetical protein
MISRFTAKDLTNSLLAGISIAMLAALFVSFHHDEILEEFGSEWVDDYAKSLRYEAKAALAQEKKTGRADALVTLLETPSWSETHFGDRAYPLKRKLLERLCVNLKQQGDYSALAHWTSQWLSLNERNLDARAFWYEAIRHFPERKEEGLEGLVTNYQNFPENDYLFNFLVNAYKDHGNTDAAKQMVWAKASSVAKEVSTGWDIFWTNANQANFSQTQSRRVRIHAGNNGASLLTFELPVDTTRLRVDPPAGSHLRIDRVELEIYGNKNRIPAKNIDKSQMRLEPNGLVAYGRDDPYFALPIKIDVHEGVESKVKVTVQFQASLIIGGYELPLADLLEQE